MCGRSSLVNINGPQSGPWTSPGSRRQMRHTSPQRGVRHGSVRPGKRRGVRSPNAVTSTHSSTRHGSPQTLHGTVSVTRSSCRIRVTPPLTVVLASLDTQTASRTNAPPEQPPCPTSHSKTRAASTGRRRRPPDDDGSPEPPLPPRETRSRKHLDEGEHSLRLGQKTIDLGVRGCALLAKRLDLLLGFKSSIDKR